ncbi:hypothetical protein ABIB25_002220 [Nakamurella sp. UYEF19]|uniref:hypothetical protein n=1 Tax=Nakamurella sp. UYEF19 TaxID=1756392 RepID=UPI0033989602
MISGKPDISLLGTVTDRAGRNGLAVGTDTNTPGYTERQTLIFDLQTGALLDYETTALAQGDLPIEAPATIGYTTWLESAKVRAIGTRSGA